MNFLCPPGPLGKHCRNDQNNDTSSGSGGGGGDDDESSGGGGGGDDDNYQGGNGGGGNDDGYYNSAAAVSSGSGGSTSESSWWNGEEDQTGTSYNQRDNSTGALVASSGKSWAMFGLISACVAAGIIATVVLRKQNTPMGACHPLRGSVNRRKELFENVFCRKVKSFQNRSIIKEDNTPTGDYNRIVSP